MSATTIEIPTGHVEAIRASLRERRTDPWARPEIDDLLGQLAGAAPAGSLRLTGPRLVLWSAVYDALCAAAEALADECNDYWRGGADPAATRRRIAEVADRFELLDSLGPPPAG